jgi:hypothetical protein
MGSEAMTHTEENVLLAAAIVLLSIVSLLLVPHR